ncbi:TPA: PerC family transcriptional regulator [Escherichia coli]|nr:PerC family transcriptional regulator [Escherichia coli]HEL8022073.1 PerC family transcriptional regulator [Escherichia coli]HEL8042171.1 PerC family transcriptional regulator [Escherichia coli]HEL8045277.1 PerC family transcriptional regulator [Escherichia coli]HEL8051903.1 PerC family transcriptional regulator [Escherichia coli]
MITDSIAEELEAKGLYRRAATRWSEVLLLVDTDDEREKVIKRRDQCLSMARYSHKPTDLCAEELRQATRRTQKEMGIYRPDGEVWRNYPTKKQ